MEVSSVYIASSKSARTTGRPLLNPKEKETGWRTGSGSEHWLLIPLWGFQRPLLASKAIAHMGATFMQV